MRSGTVAVIALLCGIVGCTMTKSASQPQAASQPEPEPLSTPFVVKTVPPSTPVPEGGAAIPTRPVKNPKTDVQKQAGKAVGPIVTFAGAARADGQGMPPSSKNAQGVPVYNSVVGSGFMIVVEGKPGISNLEVGRSIYRYDPSDPKQRPDIQIEVNRPLGDGSAEVCDARRPKIGGVPAIDPPSWADTQQISNTLNDMGCRSKRSSSRTRRARWRNPATSPSSMRRNPRFSSAWWLRRPGTSPKARRWSASACATSRGTRAR